MNSYDLSREFWNWAFDNPEKISPNHVAIYFFAVEHCNRLGWKKKFGFPSQMTMDAIGIKKHSTYIRYFNELVEWGFFVLIEKSKNQYSSNIIQLKSAMPKKGEALDKAMSKHGEKQTESMGKSKRSINKQETINNETRIPAYPEFLTYARKHKPKVIEQEVNLKYEAWKENGWKDGKDKPIKNWKSKLLQTLPYMGESDHLEYVVDNSPVN